MDHNIEISAVANAKSAPLKSEMSHPIGLCARSILARADPSLLIHQAKSGLPRRGGRVAARP
jgi:hypothetical protein